MNDPLSELPGYALRRASAAMLQDLGRRMVPLGLTPTEASIMILVEANSGITQSDIGRALGIKRANMTPMTARLEERKLIARQPVDGRSHGIVLTPDGQAVLAQAWIAVRAHEAHLLSLVGEGERAALQNALRSLWAPSGL
jgi:DNA-binding MarR family transcriptional regulator